VNRTGTAFSATASPALAAGTYTARAEQSDGAGNTGLGAPVSFTVGPTIDSPASESFLATGTPGFSGIAGNAAGESAMVTLRIYAGGVATGTPVRTVAVTRSGKSWSTGTSPALPDGIYTAQAQQTDSAANSSVSNTPSFTVDTSPPSTQLISGPSGTSDSGTATFEFTSSESGATFECRLDGAAESACSSPVSYSGLANGPHVFDVRAVDRAGNRDPAPPILSWTVAVAAGPFSGPGGVAPKSLSLRTAVNSPQHGRFVTGRVLVEQAGTRVEASLLHGRVLGHFTGSARSAGVFAFRIPIGRRGRRTLARRGRLALRLQLALVPPAGARAVKTESVELRR
jgi:hypothetical protein